MAKFRLEIVTPTREAYSADVDAVSVPTANGTIQVLPKHIPLFTSLTEGEIKVGVGGKEMYLAIGGGFMEVTADLVSVLVSRAVHADELNEAEIKKAEQAARDIIKRRGEAIDRAGAQAVLRRSILELKVLRRAGKHRELPKV